MFTTLRSTIYPSKNLAADKEFWTKVTGAAPYFDQPYYVGFDVNGCELGLDPNSPFDHPVTYWKVADTRAAVAELVAAGATLNSDPRDVGEGMFMATLRDASGNVFGVIDGPEAG